MTKIYLLSQRPDMLVMTRMVFTNQSINNNLRSKEVLEEEVKQVHKVNTDKRDGLLEQESIGLRNRGAMPQAEKDQSRPQEPQSSTSQ